MSGAAALRTMPPLMFHCVSPTCGGIEWNSVTAGGGCWMCGEQGKQGRTPLPDGRTAPGLHGAAIYRASEADK